MPHVDCSRSRARMKERAKACRNFVRGPLERAADDAATEARGTLAWNDRTGKTRGTIRPRMGPGANTSSVSARGAAVFLEAGTGRYGLLGRDYVITPKNGQYLTFKINGRWIRTTRVVHPGIKPTHFMRDAAEVTRPRFLADCIDSLQTLVRK